MISNTFRHLRSGSHALRGSKVAAVRSVALKSVATRHFSATPDTPTPVDAAVNSVADAVSVSLDSVPIAAPQLDSSPTHLVIQALEHIHQFTGLPYWATILATTIAMRVVLLPLNISTARNSARMACMKPEMEKLQKAIQNPNTLDPRAKLQYQTAIRGLFSKYQCNPFKSLAAPLAQIPIFMSFFFALREMGDYIPAFHEGGALWFTDLAAADSTYILPVANAVSFLLMLELSNDNMSMKNQKLMKNIMRGVTVLLVPMTINMPQAVFMYWSANSTASVLQTIVFKNPSVKKFLDIPETPVRTAEAEEDSNPLKKLLDLTKKDDRPTTASGAEFIATPKFGASSSDDSTPVKAKPAELPKGPTFSVHPKFAKGKKSNNNAKENKDNKESK